MSDILFTPELRTFLNRLHTIFHNERTEVLYKRSSTYYNYPSFLTETQSIREDLSWKCAPLAPGLIDRRVEITGPATPRKMVINALNSDATQYMADFEDSMAPTWKNVLDGHQNMYDASRRTISFQGDGKTYELRNNRNITLMVRPRGWHMLEENYKVNGEAMSASLFDFGMHLFHNAVELIKHGHGPYFYLPKMESYLEARLWACVFAFSESYLELPEHCIRATCLIETFPAAFQMEEILYELRNYSSGLNTGRWDYIFSYIKKMRNNASFVLPDRSNLTMTVPFLSAYSTLLVKVCHKRGVHAMGGMSAFVPIKGDDAANQNAVLKVTADKLREVKAGYDGTWALHPDFVKVARNVFDEHMPGANQLDYQEHTEITAADLLYPRDIPGEITQQGIRHNIKACLLYLTAWLQGTGAVAVDGLMEDLATVEISRTQLWQWLHHYEISLLEFQKELEDVCKDYSISLDSPAVKMLEKLVDTSTFHDFVTTIGI